MGAIGGLEKKRAPVVSIDHGVRTSATCYDPERWVVAKWGGGGAGPESPNRGKEAAQRVVW